MAKQIPSYGKVLTLGAVYTENALLGEVIIQEKVDGSQFKFGVNGKGEIVIDSKNQAIHVESPGMFENGVDTIMKRKKIFKAVKPNTWFYAEYLQRPKHNIVAYTKTPKNHIVLFDAVVDSKFVERKALESLAKMLKIDVIPELWRGEITGEKIKFLKEFWTTASYLGGANVEGIVIKNYIQTVLIGGQVFPLFTKLVSPKFQEKMGVKNRKPKVDAQEFIKSFTNENRWRKAMEFVRDEGKLLGEPKDIGAIIKRIMVDIDEEETDNIKEFFYKMYIKQIKGACTHGFPEFYKELLIKQRFEKQEKTEEKNEQESNKKSG